MTNDLEKDNRWEEQYERIKRWYEKTQKIDYLEELRKKQYQNDNQLLALLFLHENSITDEGLDIFYAFFINCYHLKDWLWHSKALPTDIVGDFFDKNEAMKICHIICTGSKHLEITNPKILNKNSTYQTREEWDPSRSKNDESGYVKTRLISINGATYDMLDLSKKCMQELDKFLDLNNLTNSMNERNFKN